MVTNNRICHQIDFNICPPHFPHNPCPEPYAHPPISHSAVNILLSLFCTQIYLYSIRIIHEGQQGQPTLPQEIEVLDRGETQLPRTAQSCHQGKPTPRLGQPQSTTILIHRYLSGNLGLDHLHRGHHRHVQRQGGQICTQKRIVQELSLDLPLFQR